MTLTAVMRWVVRPIAWWGWVVLVAGCGAHAPLESALDAKGHTEVRATSVLTLARPAPRFSEAARDYLYLTPVEVNEMGTRRHYLWLGLATTVDHAWLWAERREPVTLVLVFDGLPVAVPLSAWDDPPPDVETPTPTYGVRRAQVTLDQVERLATADSIGVELLAADGSRLGFALWRGRWEDWLPFVVGVDGARPAAARRQASADQDRLAR
jgi:hypothetical protein